MKITAQLADGLKLKPSEADRIWFDDAVPGFGLRVRQSGSRSWVYQYKIGGKTRRLVIGQASAIKVGYAREIAGQHHAAVKLGRDPANEKKRCQIQAGNTFGKLVETYLNLRIKELRPRSYVEVKRHLEVNSKPLHVLPLEAIDQRAIAGRLTVVAEENGFVVVNRVRSSLSAMFGWAMKEGLAATNPVTNTNKRQEKSRDRVLTDAELRTVWLALDDNQIGTIVRLLLLTGQRRGEIAGLRWEEIDFDRNIISLPSERTKNGKPHEVPMASTVRSLLQSRPRIEGQAFVFGRGDGGFAGWTKLKNKLDAKVAAAGSFPPWRLHDLRRSAATGMANIGIQPHIIEAVLNHVSGHKGGIAGIYNRAQYGPEKAQALDRWDDHIASVVQGRRSTVISLRGRG
jgi:integrase